MADQDTTNPVTSTSTEVDTQQSTKESGVTPSVDTKAGHTQPVSTSKDNSGSIWRAEDSTGDSVLDMGIDAVTRLSGCTREDFIRIVGKAVEHNDISLLDEAFVNEKYGAYKEHFKQITQALIDKRIADTETHVKVAYGVAGSEEAWKNAVDVFNQNAPEHMKLAVKTMIDNGNVKEGAQLLMEVVRNLGVPSRTRGLPSGNGGTQTGLSAESFRKEMNELIKQAGGRSLESGIYGERYQELLARRAIGRRAGL